ncbi:non-ribosomal peptide synthetase, partial [Aspergillus uvarum CBS 121591]
GLARLLHQQVCESGAVTAIEEGEHSLSYADLHQKALALALQIEAITEGDTAPIGILIPRALNHVLCQVAVIYSGRACVPLDDKLPDSHLASMLENLSSTLVLTDATRQHRLPSFRRLSVDHTALSTGALQGGGQPIFRDGRNCSHVLHTSGTTGKPKAVEAMAEGLINLCLDPADLIRRGQRVGHGSSVIFDTSLVEIWGTLLRGATMVVIPSETVLDPVALRALIRTAELNVMQLTTSLLTVTAFSCPDAFATLDTLITGGEAINCKIIRSIFKAGAPGRIINGYGPTECSIYTLWHTVAEEEALRGAIPVGKAFNNIETFLVTEEGVRAQPGEVGELLVGGPGVARRYIGNPEKTAQAFVRMPQLKARSTRGPGHLYRTGDLMRADPNGDHFYLGRKDNQVKIRGQRVELEALEANLLETRLVSAAVVIKITPEEVDKGQFLLAYCVPTSPDVPEGAILRAYIDRSPHLMVPRIQLIATLPLSATGKADRKALEQQYYDTLQRSRARAANVVIDADDVAAQLERIWLDVFGLPDERLAPTADFVALGGTSLMAATMITRLNKALGVSVRAAMLYENPTFEQLVPLLMRLQAEGDVDQSARTEQEIWLQDSQLGQTLQPRADGLPVPQWQSPGEGRIFLTGATGFVGIHLLVSLIQREEVQQVVCLVRAADDRAALLRLQKTAAKYGLNLEGQKKVVALAGNFALPRLGLAEAQYDHWARWSSVIFHLGAKVSYVAPYTSHRAENVIGTLEMLHFTNHGRLKAMHYSSTIAAYGPTGYVTGAKFLPEDERPASHLAALHYDTGYAQSQYVAEAIVWSAIDNGFPVAVYRPGFVLGHSQSGICNPDDFVSRVFNSCMSMGEFPLLPDQRKEFVPVDFVVEAMLHVSRSAGNLGHAYNLVQPDLVNAIDIDRSFEILQQISPHPLRGVPYVDWVNSLSLRLDDPLHPLTPMLKETVLGDKTRWEVYEKMAEYGRDNIRRALQDAPAVLHCEPIAVIFERSLKSWMP